MTVLTIDRMVRECIQGLLADYQDAIRCGEGAGTEDLAGLITEIPGAAPPGMTATETGVYSRARMVADFEHPERSQGLREIGAKLRAWKPAVPGFLPVVVAAGGGVWLVTVCIVTVHATTEVGDA